MSSTKRSPAVRSPSVLVTDARQRPAARSGAQRPSSSGGPPRLPSTSRISVDNVLQYSSEIPSGQPRGPPGQRMAHVRRISGGGLPNLASRTGQHNMPSRTTRISEKLVLIPETDDQAPMGEELEAALGDDEERPLHDDEIDILKRRGGIRGKSYAERLPKVQRTDKLSRVTAYCTAQSYKMKATSEFLRKRHDAKTKLYDDCLYAVYHIPLLPGTDGYRVRSRPIMKTPGTGKTVLDLEIERSERSDEHMGLYEDYHYDAQGQDGLHTQGGDHHNDRDQERLDIDHDRPFNRLAPEFKNFAEMFVYSYGVVVFWNFTEQQEKNILGDLAFAENEESGVSLVTRPLEQSDFETEEFHFEYSANIQRPRVFNDMITLLPRSDHMVKLTISHAIAQSTKLSFFEERMSETMATAQDVPKQLALTGELNMTRTEIVTMLGRLFKSRVDINLSSNILDVPNFFWDSEPTLHPLYVAIREYLEIGQRIKVLNERCRVFLDLAEILSDSVNDAKMSSINWIIIILIVVSILVAVTEVALRFGILAREKDKENGHKVVANGTATRAEDVVLRTRLHGAIAHASLDELRVWSAGLTDQQRGAVCGHEYIGTTFKGV